MSKIQISSNIPVSDLPIFRNTLTVIVDGTKYRAWPETVWDQVLTTEGKTLQEYLEDLLPDPKEENLIYKGILYNTEEKTALEQLNEMTTQETGDVYLVEGKVPIEGVSGFTAYTWFGNAIGWTWGGSNDISVMVLENLPPVLQQIPELNDTVQPGMVLAVTDEGHLAWTDLTIDEIVAALEVEIATKASKAELTQVVEDVNSSIASVVETTNTALATKANVSDIPTALPNPSPLVFTGATSGSYLGDTEFVVNIPEAVEIPPHSGITGRGEPDQHPISSITQLTETLAEKASVANLDIVKVTADAALPRADISEWALSNTKPSYTAEEIGALPSSTPIPSKVSDLNQDISYITNTVNDLINYYTKEQGYSKEQVDSLFASFKTLKFTVVEELPVTGQDGIIYLITHLDDQGEFDYYVEYFWHDNKFDRFGTTTVDLSNYYTIAQIDAIISDIRNILSSKANTSDVQDAITTLQSSIALKADKAATETAISNINTVLVDKADKTELIDKADKIETNTAIENINMSLTEKADKATTENSIATINTKLEDKADKTATETAINSINTSLAEKANTSDIPTKLPNPQKIVFTGAATGEYDGSTELEVNIPEGGQGGTGDHTKLTNRDAEDQHPIGSVSGLTSALEEKASVTELAGVKTTADAALPKADISGWALATEKPVYTAAEVGALPENTEYVTKAVNDLINYYTKEQGYSKQQIDDLFSSFVTLRFRVVETLPEIGEAGIIYLIAHYDSEGVFDFYVEWFWHDEQFDIFGTNEINLEDYYTITQIDAIVLEIREILNTKANITDVQNSIATLQSAIDSKANKSELDNKADKTATETAISTLNANLNNKLSLTSETAQTITAPSITINSLEVTSSGATLNGEIIATINQALASTEGLYINNTDILTETAPTEEVVVELSGAAKVYTFTNPANGIIQRNNSYQFSTIIQLNDSSATYYDLGVTWMYNGDVVAESVNRFRVNNLNQDYLSMPITNKLLTDINTVVGDNYTLSITGSASAGTISLVTATNSPIVLVRNGPIILSTNEIYGTNMTGNVASQATINAEFREALENPPVPSGLVTSVNTITPDASGNVTLDTVTSITMNDVNYTPSANGNVDIGKTLTDNNIIAGQGITISKASNLTISGNVPVSDAPSFMIIDGTVDDNGNPTTLTVENDIVSINETVVRDSIGNNVSLLADNITIDLTTDIDKEIIYFNNEYVLIDPPIIQPNEPDISTIPESETSIVVKVPWDQPTLSSNGEWGVDELSVKGEGYPSFTWIENTISSTSREWRSVCYGKDRFVAVANGTYSAYSLDGITWIENTISSTIRNWRCVCYGNNRFVIITWDSNYSAYSLDGITWVENIIGSTSRRWHSVCYGNDRFVTVTFQSTISAYSLDGITWVENTISNTIRVWNSVCYGKDRFVTVSDSKHSAYSLDGITWVENKINDNNRTWISVCYGKDRFVVVVYNSTISAYSLDGITWVENKISNTSRNWWSVCYGNDRFVTVGRESTIGAYSLDGITWVEYTISSTIRVWNSVCYGKDRFVVVAVNATYSAHTIFPQRYEMLDKKSNTSFIFDTRLSSSNNIEINSLTNLYISSLILYNSSNITPYPINEFNLSVMYTGDTEYTLIDTFTIENTTSGASFQIDLNLTSPVNLIKIDILTTHTSDIGGFGEISIIATNEINAKASVIWVNNSYTDPKTYLPMIDDRWEAVAINPPLGEVSVKDGVCSVNNFDYSNRFKYASVGDKKEVASWLNGHSPTTLPATNITYDNTESKLTATNVQSAVNELNEKIESGEWGVSNHNDLTGRNEPNQHTTSSITGLDTTLASKLNIANIKAGNNILIGKNASDITVSTGETAAYSYPYIINNTGTISASGPANTITKVSDTVINVDMAETTSTINTLAITDAKEFDISTLENGEYEIRRDTISGEYKIIPPEIVSVDAPIINQEDIPYTEEPWVQPVLTSNGDWGVDDLAVRSTVPPTIISGITFYEYNAMDNIIADTNACWQVQLADMLFPEYYEIFTKEQINISSISITNRNFERFNTIGEGAIEASTDGIVWAEIAKINNINKDQAATWDIVITENTNVYQYHRIRIDTYIQLAIGGVPAGFTIAEIDIVATYRNYDTSLLPVWINRSAYPAQIYSYNGYEWTQEEQHPPVGKITIENGTVTYIQNYPIGDINKYLPYGATQTVYPEWQGTTLPESTDTWIRKTGFRHPVWGWEYEWYKYVSSIGSTISVQTLIGNIGTTFTYISEISSLCYGVFKSWSRNPSTVIVYVRDKSISDTDYELTAPGAVVIEPITESFLEQPAHVYVKFFDTADRQDALLPTAPTKQLTVLPESITEWLVKTGRYHPVLGWEYEWFKKVGATTLSVGVATPIATIDFPKNNITNMSIMLLRNDGVVMNINDPISDNKGIRAIISNTGTINLTTYSLGVTDIANINCAIKFFDTVDRPGT